MVSLPVFKTHNNVWHSAVIDFRCVSCRILRFKFRFSSVKVYLVVGYGLNKRNSEERERF